jgi:hypothetical protein
LLWRSNLRMQRRTRRGDTILMEDDDWNVLYKRYGIKFIPNKEWTKMNRIEELRKYIKRTIFSENHLLIGNFEGLAEYLKKVDI